MREWSGEEHAAWRLAEMLWGSMRGEGKQSLPGGGHVGSFSIRLPLNTLFYRPNGCRFIWLYPSYLLSRPPTLSFLLSRFLSLKFNLVDVAPFKTSLPLSLLHLAASPTPSHTLPLSLPAPSYHPLGISSPIWNGCSMRCVAPHPVPTDLCQWIKHYP